MTRVIRKIIGTILGAFLLVAAAGSRADAAAILSIDPAVKDVFLGETFLLDVLVTDADDLYAYDLEVSFGNTIVKALALLDGPFLSANGTVATDGLIETIDNTEGFVSGSDSRLGQVPGANGDGRLFSIRFKAIGVGTTAIDFDVVCDQNDPFCSELRDSNDSPSAFATTAGVVNVLPRGVPEPGLLALLGAGLLAARSHFRRRR